MKEYDQLSYPTCLALVKMANNSKYLFRAPVYVLRIGMSVVCKTVNGEQPGVVTSIVIVETPEELDFVLEAAHISRLEPVVGITNISYLNDQATYIRGKGIAQEPLPETISSAKEDDPWITVHMPDGTAYIN